MKWTTEIFQADTAVEVWLGQCDSATRRAVAGAMRDAASREFDHSERARLYGDKTARSYHGRRWQHLSDAASYVEGTLPVERNCDQCGRDMNPAEWMLGPVCGKCCRANHRAVAGGR
jgi:hypothetical protein